PACLGGEVVGPFPNFISKTDEERIQNLASEFEAFQGLKFYLSEKLDGTSFTAFTRRGEFGVCGRNWQLAEDASNSHWRVVRRMDLQSKLMSLGRNLAVQAELVGPGIQKNRYGIKEPMIYVFNMFDIDDACYVEKAEMEAICGQLELETVPSIGEADLPKTIDDVLTMAEGKSRLNEKVEREGLVWVSGSGPTRVSFKAISNRFLTKGGD
ncbi:MAG: RNA ligase family protein, partial [Planctomycetota bacterium]